MRTLLFTPNFPPARGGAERMADAVARGLRDRGHDLAVLAQHAAPPPGAPPFDPPYPVHRYRRPPAQHLWPESLAWPVLRLRRGFAFDAVLAFYAYPTGYAACVARRLACGRRHEARPGFRVVVSPRGGDLYPSFHALRKPRVRRVIAAGYRDADRVVSISRWLTSRIGEVTGLPEDRLPPIDLAPNGLDLASFDAEFAAARAAAPIVRPPYLLSLARLAPVKQPGRVLDALATPAARAALRRHDARYAVAGEGSLRDTLEAQARTLGLADRVVFLGHRTGDDKANLLAHAHAFVSASREEGMPNAVIEAVAAGLPVLASDIGPHREVIHAGAAPCGVLADPHDASGFGQAIAAVLDGDVTPYADAARARRSAYDLDRTLDAYDRSLREAVAAD